MQDPDMIKAADFGCNNKVIRLLGPLRSLIPIALMLLLLSGCNDDIFIERSDLPEVSDYTVDGTDGEMQFVISSKDIEHIGIDNISSSDPDITYIGKDGKIISADSPASELGSILYSGVDRYFQFTLRGDILYFHSYYNCTDEDYTVSVRLRYSYGSKVINFNVTRSKPIELVIASYCGDMKVTPDFEVSTNRFTFHNNSTLPQTIYWQPLKHARPARIYFKSKDEWTKGLDLGLSLPVYLADEWMLHDYKIPVKCFEWIEYPSLDEEATEQIHVPANSSLTIVSKVSYSKIETSGEIEARNPVSDAYLSSSFTSTAYYPVSYEIYFQN